MENKKERVLAYSLSKSINHDELAEVEVSGADLETEDTAVLLVHFELQGGEDDS